MLDVGCAKRFGSLQNVSSLRKWNDVGFSNAA